MPYAVVTGATQGIGKAIAEKLLKEDFSIAVCARNGENLRKIEREWKKRYPLATVVAFVADLADKHQASSFADAVMNVFPSLDILVNNAGTFLPGDIETEKDGTLETLMSVNVYSAYYLTRFLLPAIGKAEVGHIFNMCSVASLKAYPNGGSYSISKYALLGFSDNLREELKPAGIKVTAICPGATYTASWEGSGVSPERIMEAADVSAVLWNAYNLSPSACVEHIVLRPVKGDL